MSHSNAYRLYKVSVSVYTGDAGPLVTYLVHTDGGPAAAASLAIDRSVDRWPDYRSVEVLRVWEYPTGELALAGADPLEMVGRKVDVADLGARHAT